MLSDPQLSACQADAHLTELDVQAWQSQPLGWTKHFISYKPKIIDPMMYFFFFFFFFFAGGWEGNGVYGPSKLFHLFWARPISVLGKIKRPLCKIKHTRSPAPSTYIYIYIYIYIYVCMYLQEQGSRGLQILRLGLLFFFRGIFIATFKRTYIQDQARPIIVTSVLSYETSPYFSLREKSLLPKFLSQLEPCRGKMVDWLVDSKPKYFKGWPYTRWWEVASFGNTYM